MDAALNAAKEAVKQQTDTSEKAIAKSEASTAAQSQQQNVTFTANFKGLTDVLTDVKERVVKIENRKIGADDTHASARLDIGAVVGILALLVSAMAVLMVVFR